jgi:hypothetical protein
MVEVPEVVQKERAPSVEEVKAPIPEFKKLKGPKPVVEKPEVVESPQKGNSKPNYTFEDQPPVSARSEKP